MTAKNSNSNKSKNTPSQTSSDKPEDNKGATDKKAQASNNTPAKKEVKAETASPQKPTAKTPPPSTASQATTAKQGAKGATALAVIAIILAGGSAFALYKQGQTQHQQQAQVIEGLENKLVAQLSQQQNEAAQAQSEQITLLQQQLLESQTLNTSMQERINQQGLSDESFNEELKTLQRNVAEMTVRHPSDWMLSEAEYLMRMAGRKLWLEHDINTAISLLNAADQRISELGDASLNPLRRAIIDDITTLEALPRIDKDGLVMKLASLEQTIDELNLAGVNLPEALEEKNYNLSSDVADWRENLSKSMHSFLESFVTITKRDGKVEALLAPEQSWYLKENIKSQLVKAQIAVYREQQAIYSESLEKSIEWIQHYYNIEDAATKQFIATLTNLSKKDITVNYPDQLRAKPMLENVIEKRVRKSLAPMSPPGQSKPTTQEQDYD
ncbi:uroporphyrinogen-III C-methyltransferase [Motilimonas pumila]|uniref:Heme biosynthesis operon protein HemX n=1 Tax=Motilimonas pumila TaxID=2303987 RepID=A0A418YBR1_9GAMM|nr:uroporphyrinogen-III C-methyltransferase [Motilimonas pumila]RJG41947.1 hypothetical protein D1Z90_15765 [Motilimonas pumila]